MADCCLTNPLAVVQEMKRLARSYCTPMDPRDRTIMIGILDRLEAEWEQEKERYETTHV